MLFRSQSKEPQKDLEEIKPKKNFALKLSKQELLHLRDIFSVLLPPDMKLTVSQSLAASQGRHLVETKLWNKISSLCSEAEIPVGDEAPDFVITLTSPPSLGVFEMITDQDDGVDQEVARGLEGLLEDET